MYDDLGDKAIMVAPLQIGAQLIDWTDPQKSMCVECAELVEQTSADLMRFYSRHDRVKTDEAIHFDLALRMTKQLYQEEQSKFIKSFFSVSRVTDIFFGQRMNEN